MRALREDGKLTVDDLTGRHRQLITNPGTLGTTQSVPRLMAGQGAIFGVGALDYPMEHQWQPMPDERSPRRFGVAKGPDAQFSTYDHRIIQGAESGVFLKHVHELLVGEHGFYEQVFAALGVSAAPVHWQRDRRRLAASPEDVAGALGARVALLVDWYLPDPAVTSPRTWIHSPANRRRRRSSSISPLTG